MGGIRAGAGEGNRTLVISFEGFCSTIELHPPSVYEIPSPMSAAEAPCQLGGGGWIRTNVGARPTDLQSAPFSRSGTPPAEPEIMSCFRQVGKIKSTFLATVRPSPSRKCPQGVRQGRIRGSGSRKVPGQTGKWRHRGQG